MKAETYRYQSAATVKAPQVEVFTFLDDQVRLGGHMKSRSLMMLGGKMHYEFDTSQGHQVGSVIRISGRFLGLSLLVREVVTERTPPASKRWETRGAQRMLVIESYTMGFETRVSGSATDISVYIGYQLPQGMPWYWVGRLLAPLYARWCVSSMVNDTRRHFDSGLEPGVPA